MGMNKNLKKLVLVVAATTALMGCSSIASLSGDVYATVGKTKITQKDVDKILESQINNLKSQYGEDFEASIDETVKQQLNAARQNVAKTLVETEIVKAKAKEFKLISSEDEINELAEQKVNEIKSNYQDEATFTQALNANGYTDEESFKERAKDQVIFDKVIEHITKDVTVTDEEVNTYYEENKETEFVKQAGAEVRHILFKDDEEGAKELRAKIEAGTSFDELFKEYEGNKAKNLYPIAEDLKYVMYNQQNFDPAFLEGLKSLKEGEVSQPVKSSFGHHIIEAKNVSAEDSIEPFENVKENLKAWLLQTKQYDLYQEKLNEWKEEAKVKYNEELVKEENTAK